MDLDLRKVRDAYPESYRVVLKEDGDEIELGSIGIQRTAGLSSEWHWGIDCVIPMREVDAQGAGKDRADCMRKFRAAWDRFSSDRARLTEFLEMKRKRL